MTVANAGRDLAPLNRIRVETAFSRFPVHCLAKKRTVSIDLQDAVLRLLQIRSAGAVLRLRSPQETDVQDSHSPSRVRIHRQGLSIRRRRTGRASPTGRCCTCPVPRPSPNMRDSPTSKPAYSSRQPRPRQARTRSRQPPLTPTCLPR
jgi:hypothetical protein